MDIFDFAGARNFVLSQLEANDVAARTRTKMLAQGAGIRTTPLDVWETVRTLQQEQGPTEETPSPSAAEWGPELGP